MLVLPNATAFSLVTLTILIVVLNTNLIALSNVDPFTVCLFRFGNMFAKSDQMQIILIQQIVYCIYDELIVVFKV